MEFRLEGRLPFELYIQILFNCADAGLDTLLSFARLNHTTHDVFLRHQSALLLSVLHSEAHDFSRAALVLARLQRPHLKGDTNVDIFSAFSPDSIEALATARDILSAIHLHRKLLKISRACNINRVNHSLSTSSCGRRGAQWICLDQRHWVLSTYFYKLDRFLDDEGQQRLWSAVRRGEVVGGVEPRAMDCLRVNVQMIETTSSWMNLG